MTDRSEIRALLHADPSWGTHGSSIEHQRYAHRITGRIGRRKCDCGCGRRSTHTGCANGVALTSGCELAIRRWVRDGTGPYYREQP